MAVKTTQAKIKPDKDLEEWVGRVGYAIHGYVRSAGRSDLKSSVVAAQLTEMGIVGFWLESTDLGVDVCVHFKYVKEEAS